MRFLLYNIAYCTGGPRSARHSMLTMHRYLRSARHHLDQICSFVEDQAPDVLGLVEVDRGSLRSRRRDQVAEIARALSHEGRFANKYGQQSVLRHLPFLKHQGNAVLTREPPAACTQHFFQMGLKRLVLEVDAGGVTYFLVHLSLRAHTRREQVAFLTELVGETSGPVVLAGDFNSFGGRRELRELMTRTGLRNANSLAAPTYPSWAARHELDFVLCSPQVKVQRLAVLDGVRHSDHLPLVLDFEI